MAMNDSCPPEESYGAAAAPTVIQIPSIGGVSVAGFDLSPLMNFLQSLFNLIRSALYAFIRPASQARIQQFLITDTTKFTLIAILPSDALQWELTNSNMTGLPVGNLQYAYVPSPGLLGNGQFNNLASGDRITRALAGVSIYVKPDLTNQVCVLEWLQP